MPGFTKPQLARTAWANKTASTLNTLSSKEFDAQMSDLKAEQSAVNAIRQRMLDARRKVDGWIGGEFRSEGPTQELPRHAKLRELKQLEVVETTQKPTTSGGRN